MSERKDAEYALISDKTLSVSDYLGEGGGELETAGRNPLPHYRFQGSDRSRYDRISPLIVDLGIADGQSQAVIRQCRLILSNLISGILPISTPYSIVATVR